VIRATLWLFVAFAGLVAIAVGAAWWFADDDPTRRIAIFAAVVASAGGLKNLYDIWDKMQEKRKKADESAERIKAVPLFDSFMTASPTVGVEIHNEGKVPVPIRRVALVIKTEAGEAGYPMVTTGDMETRHYPDGRPYSDRQYLNQAKLDPADPSVEFFVQFMPKDARPNQLAAMSPENLWIRVESNKGVVARVEGAEIQAVIKEHFRPRKGS
jgi:hypothetical protein